MNKFLCKLFGHKWKMYTNLPRMTKYVCKRCGKELNIKN